MSSISQEFERIKQSMKGYFNKNEFIKVIDTLEKNFSATSKSIVPKEVIEKKFSLQEKKIEDLIWQNENEFQIV